MNFPLQNKNKFVTSVIYCDRDNISGHARENQSKKYSQAAPKQSNER